MKILKQFLIILIFTYLGSILSKVLPVNIPGNVLGIILLFLALEFKLVKKEDIKETANWLVKNMAFLFVPISVGLMNDFDILKANLVNLSIVLIVSTTFTMIVVAIVAEKLEVKK